MVNRPPPASPRHTDRTWASSNITTPPAHRRRGYGRAVTKQIVRDAVASGRTVLHGAASSQGIPLYASLRGTTLETWTHSVAG